MNKKSNQKVVFIVLVIFHILSFYFGYLFNWVTVLNVTPHFLGFIATCFYILLWLALLFYSYKYKSKKVLQYYLIFWITNSTIILLSVIFETLGIGQVRIIESIIILPYFCSMLLTMFPLWGVYAISSNDLFCYGFIIIIFGLLLALGIIVKYNKTKTNYQKSIRK